ncbi:carbohydrate-binding protein [Actinobaculum sp. 352]|uniref:carbohydrate-binding protein n=1 Tax=Actinobaculum sp. 352 TaxID=2490946 RepID=UPI0013E02BFC|nr:carbohydrate-binding protein [Actinobaculum sp. 352]
MAVDLDLVGISEADWGDFYAAVLREQQRRLLLATAAQQAETLAAQYAAAVETQPARQLADIPTTGAVGPGEKVVIDGITWENISGAWLSPHTAGPDVYPLGWRNTALAQPGAADTYPTWAVGTAYTTGTLVTYQGTVYRCVIAHTSQADWTPPAVPALWTIA